LDVKEAKIDEESFDGYGQEPVSAFREAIRELSRLEGKNRTMVQS
jgi:hypothetical protein